MKKSVMASLIFMIETWLHLFETPKIACFSLLIKKKNEFMSQNE